MLQGWHSDSETQLICFKTKTKKQNTKTTQIKKHFVRKGVIELLPIGIIKKK